MFYFVGVDSKEKASMAESCMEEIKKGDKGFRVNPTEPMEVGNYFTQYMKMYLIWGSQEEYERICSAIGAVKVYEPK